MNLKENFDLSLVQILCFLWGLIFTFLLVNQKITINEFSRQTQVMILFGLIKSVQVCRIYYKEYKQQNNITLRKYIANSEGGHIGIKNLKKNFYISLAQSLCFLRNNYINCSFQNKLYGIQKNK